MADAAASSARADPYRNFRFRVRCDGQAVPGISRVSALRRVTDDIEYREGSELATVRHLAGITRFEPVRIERGLTGDPSFADWAAAVASAQPSQFRKDVTIELLDASGAPALAFILQRAWPFEYEALSELDAEADAIAVERLTLVVEGWERIAP